MALASVCLGFFMILLDGSALNVALQDVASDVHGSMAALQWVVNGYTIPLASVLLTAGSAGDRWGVKRVFAISLACFTLASLLCSLAPGLDLLIAARIIQGIAAGGVLPTTLAIIANTYTDPLARGRAITAWGATGGVALIAGPIGGGLLTDLYGWRAIFAINVPIGVATHWLARHCIQESPRKKSARLDIPGQLAVIIALSTLVAYLIEGGTHGWTTPTQLVTLAVGVIAVVGFIAIEYLSPCPMLPLRVFRRASFTASICSGFFFQFAGYGSQFMFAVYLQQNWHLSAIETGMYFVPFAASWICGILFLNRRLVSCGPRLLLWTGSLISFAGTLLLIPVESQSTSPLFLAGTVVTGLGCGVFGPSLNGAALMSIDAAYLGLGSGILNTVRQVGMAIGVALLGTLIAKSDAVFGLRVGTVIISLCFFSITVLSLRYIPSKERSAD